MMINRILLFISLLPCFILKGCAQECAYKGGTLDYLSRIGCQQDLKLLKGLPLSQKYGDVASVKVIYKWKEKKLYLLQSLKYKLHFDFCSDYLNEYQHLGQFNMIEYSESPMRRYVLCNLNHYEGPDIFTLEFFADDQVPIDKIIAVFREIRDNTYFGDKLVLFVNSPRLLELRSSLPADIPTLTTNDLYSNQVYQPINAEYCYGYLRKVSVKDFPDYPFSPHDIILSDGLPNTFPICQGIITATFQTPLCHVNVLSINRGTPNSAYKNAWEDARMQALEGKLVYYSVTQDSLIIRPASLEKAMKFWEKQRAGKSKRALKKDVSIKTLVDLPQMNHKMVGVVGGKAANFGELGKIKLGKGEKLPIPEGAFAIPFYFYEQHVSTPAIQSLIKEVLSQDTVWYHRELLEEKLKMIRKKIKEQPVHPQLLQMVEAQIRRNGLPYTRYRFRSSTNAEDIKGFTGAGLYTSKTGVLNDTTQSIEKAIRQVWASIWNLRAFQERCYYNIENESVSMGVLVHRTFGDEAANGVAITRNIYRSGYPSFTLNIQEGETSVVLPPSDTITCEQMLVHLYEGNPTRNKNAMEYITRSNISSHKDVMNPAEVERLIELLQAVKQHFYNLNFLSGQAGDASYYDFGMDVEFKLDKDTRKIYIKQARRYEDGKK